MGSQDSCPTGVRGEGGFLSRPLLFLGRWEYGWGLSPLPRPGDQRPPVAPRLTVATLCLQ